MGQQVEAVERVVDVVGEHAVGLSDEVEVADGVVFVGGGFAVDRRAEPVDRVAAAHELAFTLVDRDGLEPASIVVGVAGVGVGGVGPHQPAGPRVVFVIDRALGGGDHGALAGDRVVLVRRVAVDRVGHGVGPADPVEGVGDDAVGGGHAFQRQRDLSGGHARRDHDAGGRERVGVVVGLLDEPAGADGGVVVEVGGDVALEVDAEGELAGGGAAVLIARELAQGGVVVVHRLDEPGAQLVGLTQRERAGELPAEDVVSERRDVAARVGDGDLVAGVVVAVLVVRADEIGFGRFGVIDGGEPDVGEPAGLVVEVCASPGWGRRSCVARCAPRAGR